MYSKVLFVLAVAALASANDLFIAVSNNTEGHEKIFDQHIEAQWAITKQTREVFVNVTEGVICLVNVTDLRPNKDAEARISSGGLGQKNVTITLSSPAAFRGFDFRVEVFSHTHEEVERGHHHVEPEVPEAPQNLENKTAKSVTEIVPSSQHPEVTDSTGTTEAEVPEQTGNPVRPATDKPVTVTHKPADVPVLVMGMDRVPKGVEQPPEMQAFVEFRPPHRG